ncbi:FGGY-family carbohydrate kinase [Tropicibacter naphthalenivorans]|uniref:Erythritol kinase n=1 Tax=Tropicibacter naphthalenivorans TaxID=441103 RepID=A0A0P1GYY7_9RHOB|nr:FGGY-family carbohydrate kinase [Tropicibacter naphthalenivorans]CUH79781.1 Erythritol kinase [Tropicibacter naphthalenivorans]SMC75168.1 erythritol kinase (L-erythritol 4-phosphate-forming) [Tropicibacter naphthalenivorans]
MTGKRDIIVGIDAGTSVIKAVAFDLSGTQLGASSVRNTYVMGADGSATQSLPQTWKDCASALRGLGREIDDLSARVAAVAVTGQGDGTWLADADNNAVGDAWLWLDARAAPTVSRLAAGPLNRARFEATGTGLNTCQQGAQMAHMDAHFPELLDRADVALHCKDWLFLNLTGVRATDPSEASFTFGDFRTRAYSDVVIEALGLSHRRHLLPPIMDGAQKTRPLTRAAAEATGLPEGTPVSLGYVDMVMTALGAGVHTGDAGAACSTVGSTGVHTRAVLSVDVHLNDAGTGYVICLPSPDLVTQVQTNMAATLNIDWALDMAADLVAEFCPRPTHAQLVGMIDNWMAKSRPGALVYHPYISEAGERGPFVEADARASLIGLTATHRFADVIRAVIEGLGMAARDCYAAMGEMPTELRLTGGAARSNALRRVLAASLNTPVRVSSREEAGAAGCAMMAAVAIGAYPDMDACIAEWTTPLLGAAEQPDPELTPVYDSLFTSYRQSRQALAPVWTGLAGHRATHLRSDT